MVKSVIRGSLALGLMFAFVAIPSATAARLTQPVSQEFKNCQSPEKLLKIRRPFRMKGPCVWRLQRFLNETKWMVGHTSGGDISKWPTLIEDGVYGPQTRKAVIEYQKLKKADPGASAVDGIVGPKTWGSINKDCTEAWTAANFYSQSCFAVSVPEHARWIGHR